MATIVTRQRVVDVRPASMLLRAYAGDPFAINIKLTVNGGPPAQDLTGWVWTAQVRIPDAIVGFQTRNAADGVELSMGGADTERISVGGRYWRWSLHGRNPLASEGYTLIDGHMIAAPKVASPPVPITLPVEVPA
jgi:hypothetical protein